MKKIVLILLLFKAVSLYAQLPSEYTYLIDSFPDKDNVYLLDKREITILVKKDSLCIDEVYTSKEYYTSNKSGIYALASVDVSYFDEMKSIKAYTLSKIEGEDKYKKYNVKDFTEQQSISNYVFYDDIITVKYQYPFLKKESIAYVEYEKGSKSPYIPFIEFFSSYTTMLEKEFTVKVDNNVDLSIKYYNVDEEEISYTKVETEKYTLHKWEMQNTKPYIYESSAPNVKHYLPHIVLQIESYVTSKGKRINVVRNESDLFGWYSGFLGKVNFDSTEAMQAVLDDIIVESMGEGEKVKTVFQWVQNNIKYIALADGLGGFIPRDPDLVLSRRYGDCKDMSILIYSFLKLLDIEAHPTWVGTRDVPYKYTEQPSTIVDNHMIVTYVCNETGENIFLDATDSYISYGLPTAFIQGKEVMIHKGDTFFIEIVPIIKAEQNIISDTTNLKICDNMLCGEGVIKTTSYIASYYKTVMNRISSDERIKEFVSQVTEKGSNKYKLLSYELQNNENEYFFYYSFELKDYLSENENELYINLNLDRLLFNMEKYKEGERELPVEVGYAKIRHSYYTLAIPEGYVVAFLPPDVEYKTEKFGFNIDYTKVDDYTITYEIRFYADYLILEIEDFLAYEQMIDKIKEAYQENLILQKQE
jgi:transglutaminase-like putative cysteine protease